MKTLLVNVLCIFTALTLPSVSHAKGDSVSFADGVTRLVGGASWGKNRSVWARGKSLVLVMPPHDLQKQVIKPKHPIVREVRLSGYSNRMELELRLNMKAMDLLPRVQIREIGGDLTIALTPETALTASAKPASPAASSKEGAAAAGVAAPAASASAAAAAAAANKPAARAGKKATKLPWSKRLEPNKLGLKAPSGGGAGIWIMLLLVSLAAGAAWWLKRRKRQSSLGDAAHIDVVASRALSGKHRLVLVEAAGELILLGCTDKEINLLRAVDRSKLQQHQEDDFFAEGLRMDTDNVDTTEPAFVSAPAPAPAPAPSPAPAPAPAPDFRERLTAQMERKRNTIPVEQPGDQNNQGDPLDERWAEGILKLRKARATRGYNGSSTEGLLH